METRAEHERAIVAAATHFTAFQYRGPARRIKVNCATEAQARAEGRRLQSEYPRPALIYAVAGVREVCLGQP